MGFETNGFRVFRIAEHNRWKVVGTNNRKILIVSHTIQLFTRVLIVQIRDFNLGETLPVIKGVTVSDVKIKDHTYIEVT